MKLLYACIVLTVVLPACNNSRKEDIANGKKDNTLKAALIGQWRSPAKQRPTYDITEDSIYHFGQDKTYPYKLENNDLILIENGFQVRLSNIIVMRDTLVFENPPGTSIAAIHFKTKHPH
jgi:hypothetical protein